MNAHSTKRTAPPARRRRDEAKELFRNAILEGAEEIFAECGFHAARIQDIALRARIAVGTVYNHFDQKEDVLRALLEERTYELVAELAPIEGDPQPFTEKLTARLRRMLAYMDRHRGFFLVAIEHGLIGVSTAAASIALGGKKVRHLERFRAAFIALVEEGLADGALAGEDAKTLARFLGASLRAFAITALEENRAGLENDAPRIVELFLHGAGKRPARRSR